MLGYQGKIREFEIREFENKMLMVDTFCNDNIIFMFVI